MNIDDRQTFPAGFILDLTLQLRIRPRVHPAAIPSALAVSTLIQFPKASEPLHHEAEIAVLGLLHDHFRCMVENPIHLLPLLQTILVGDFAADAHIVSPHAGASLTISGLYPCRLGEVMLHDRTVRCGQCDIVQVPVDTYEAIRLDILDLLRICQR